MSQKSRTKKAIQLLLLSAIVVITSPYMLGKLNFYGNSHAEPSAPPLSAHNAQTTPDVISSTSLNAPVSYANAIALAAPAVVSIKTTKAISPELNPMAQDPFFRYFFGDPNLNGGNEWGGRGLDPNQGDVPKETQQGLGSGVIVSEKGYILTNNHVVREVDAVVITLADGRIADAKVVGTDPDTDLAVLKVELDKLPAIKMGESKKLRVGDVVLAMGNPFGLDKTVTLGIVSALDRGGSAIGILENLIQTDAAINPGNSGGALIDSFGNLVGINTAIYSRSGGNQGIGFAIPIDQATEVMNKLIEGKPIVRGFLGVMMQPLNKEIRDYISYKEGDGVYIRAVVNGSPAQKAGILPGDVMIKIDNTVIKDERMGLQMVSKLIPGKSYSVEIFRKGDIMSFAIILGERTPQSQPEKTEKNKKRN